MGYSLTKICAIVCSSTKGATGVGAMQSTFVRLSRRFGRMRRSPALLALVTAVAVGLELPAQSTSQPTPAQAAPAAEPTRRSPKRADLEAAAAMLEQRARTEKDGDRRSKYLQDASLIRRRLVDGDFQPGHRIQLFVAGDSVLSDTFTVRADQKLLLPNLPEMSLAGVLDSELQGYLQTQVAQYIRNPSVRAQALLRVSVTGDVGNPGFYSVPTDTPVSDVIMGAGGPSSSADMGHVELRRGSAVVVKRDGIQEAFRSELTMSDIGARPGDELYVPAKPDGSRLIRVAGFIAAVTGIIWSVIWIADAR